MENNGKTVLIIEDEEFLQKVLFDEFTEQGFHVLQAKNGEEGLKSAEKDKPDIMLIDILMPKMDGITMLKHLRENKQLSEIPAIILTNVNDADTMAKAIESKAYDYLIKTDWQPQDLVKRVKEKLKM